MTLHRSIAAFWLLVFLAVVVTVLDSKAQLWSVNYNPNTVVSGQTQYWNGSAWAAVVTTAAGRSMMTAADAAAQRSLLSLGTAALVDTGTSASNVPTVTQADARYGRLATSGSWGATQDMTGAGNAWYAGGATSKAGIRVHPTGAEGIMVWEYSGGGTDAKNWVGVPANNFWYFGPASDTYGSVNFAYKVDRSGETITGHSWRTGTGVGTERLGLTASGISIGGGTAIPGMYHGSATLSSGQHTETAAWATSGTRIIVTYKGTAGTVGHHLDTSVSAGASFTISSEQAGGSVETGDTSTVSWIAIVP